MVKGKYYNPLTKTFYYSIIKTDINRNLFNLKYLLDIYIEQNIDIIDKDIFNLVIFHPKLEAKHLNLLIKFYRYFNYNNNFLLTFINLYSRSIHQQLELINNWNLLPYFNINNLNMRLPLYLPRDEIYNKYILQFIELFYLNNQKMRENKILEIINLDLNYTCIFLKLGYIIHNDIVIDFVNLNFRNCIYIHPNLIKSSDLNKIRINVCDTNHFIPNDLIEVLNVLEKNEMKKNSLAKLDYFVDKNNERYDFKKFEDFLNPHLQQLVYDEDLNYKHNIDKLLSFISRFNLTKSDVVFKSVQCSYRNDKFTRYILDYFK